MRVLRARMLLLLLPPPMLALPLLGHRARR